MAAKDCGRGILRPSESQNRFMKKRKRVGFEAGWMKSAWFLADSFGKGLINDYVYGSHLDQDFIYDPEGQGAFVLRAKPHLVHNRGQDEDNRFRFIMDCEGGEKLKGCMSVNRVDTIMRNKPRCIVIMLGMCDIAGLFKTDQLFDKRWYHDTIIEVKSRFNKLAAERHTSDIDLQYSQGVIFHFAVLQNWGTEWSPRPYRIDRDTVELIRRQNSTFVRKRAGSLYNDHNILLVDLNVDTASRRRDSLHLDYDSNVKLYNTLIILIMRYICVNNDCRCFAEIPRDSDKKTVQERSRDLIHQPSCSL